MFDIMNSLSFPFNNRMDGIEIADSLLYKDLENQFSHKYYQTALTDTCAYLSGQADVNKLIIGAGFENSSMSFYGKNQMSDSYTNVETNSLPLSSESGGNYEQPMIDSIVLPNNSTSLDSKSKIYEFILENRSVQAMENSTTHFRPISANICEELNDSNSNGTIERATRNIFDYFKNNENEAAEYPNQIYYGSNDNYTFGDIGRKEMLSKNVQSITNTASNSNYTYPVNQNMLAQTSCSNEFSVLTSQTSELNTTKTIHNTNNNESSFISQCNRLSAFNTSSINNCGELNSRIQSSDKSHFSNNTSAIIPVKLPIANSVASTPIASIPSSTIGTTITIPRGSYIFIPLTVQNFPTTEIQQNLHQNASITDLQTVNNGIIGNNKYVLGCYPMISQLQDLKMPSKQLPPIITPKPVANQSSALIITNAELPKTTTSILHPSQIADTGHTLTKQEKRKIESTEYHYHLSLISDSHKMLAKEKSKISMDKNVFKDDSWKNVINYVARNNTNMNRLEKELNLLINTLFEINILVSKIEALRGISFIEPFYNILQNAAELIQSFHPNEPFAQYSSRNQNTNKPNDKDIEVQVEKFKLLFLNLQDIRTFLWASYTNATLERERLLSYSLNKLRSWCENKKSIRQSLKLKELNIKNQMARANTSSGENTNSHQNSVANSVRPTMKFDRNSMTVQTQSYSIPVSQYHTIPSRMTTILQRFPNQMPPNPNQYNYIQTSLSNFSHPTLINNNKFSIGSNCRLSYAASQQQLYTATPLNTAHTNIAPRNFLIAPSSLMTPIIYQNSSHSVINNAPVNFMLYKTNTQLI